MSAEAIVLAHEPDFRLAPGTARPSTLELEGPRGTAHLEPRVMRVLIVLHRANGGVLSRDDLTADCWDGRIVGEDAINRVIGQLRRSFAATGQQARVETIPRVGFRLIESAGSDPAKLNGVDRRWWIAGGVAAAIVLGALGMEQRKSAFSPAATADQHRERLADIAP